MDKESAYNKFLNLDIEEYKGKWIVICNEDIVAYGHDIKKILEEAKKKCPNKKMMIAKVPEEGTMIY